MFVRGQLVVKLPAPRVDKLVTDGHGERFDANKGTPMREWFSLDPGSALPWPPLAREALDFAMARDGQVTQGRWPRKPRTASDEPAVAGNGAIPPRTRDSLVPEAPWTSRSPTTRTRARFEIRRGRRAGRFRASSHLRDGRDRVHPHPDRRPVPRPRPGRSVSGAGPALDATPGPGTWRCCPTARSCGAGSAALPRVRGT